MRKCRVCGFPTMLNRLIGWNDNGTIVSRQKEDFRVLLIEADFFTKLLDSIEDELDLPVRRMVFETQRDASRIAIDADLTGLFHGLGKKGPFKRLSNRFLDYLALLCGQCYCDTTDYHPGISSGGIIRNPFDKDLIAAIVMGAMEALEGVPYRHEWRKKERGFYLYAEPEPGGIKRDVPALLELAPAKPGNHRIERCPRCDAPLAMRDLKWIKQEGIIMDIRKGVRMIFLDFYAFKMVVEKLSRELGPEFAPIVVDTQRGFFLRHIWEEFLSERRGAEPLPQHQLYRQVLETLALRGQGNPVEHSLEDKVFAVTVENPFNEYLLAGFLSALYECSESVVPKVTWEWADGQTLRFVLRPD